LTDYLTQALYEPGAYLVEGYADIMPAATAAPAKLSYEEVVAAINYLQSLGGKPSAKVGDIPRPPAEAAASSEETLTDPAALFASFKCAACHSLEPAEVRVGPTLAAASLQKAAADRGTSPEGYVMESIVDPEAFESEGFSSGVMPTDFGATLTAGQLQALVEYLLSPGVEQ
jgi:mono/diheme cytochrome c family protein